MTGHEPVLVEEVMRALAPKQSDTVVDATVGGAGHFRRLLEALGESGTIVGIDADAEALARAQKAYDEHTGARPTMHLVNDNFRNLSHVLAGLGMSKIDVILFDLGWSGYQLAALRGFSFGRREDPLLMAYGAGPTAAEIVNSAGESELAEILAHYSEERFARPIAHAIVERRSKGRILTVGDLVDAVLEGTPNWYHSRRIHPATKTFQALRIAVNDELGALSEGLAGALAALGEGGRLAVITFHSLEDRVVKRAFKEAEERGEGEASKKPITPTRPEITGNPRSRSAKLRFFTLAISSSSRVCTSGSIVVTIEPCLASRAGTTKLPAPLKSSAKKFL